MSGMSELRTRGGVSRGRESREFTVQQVLRALRDPEPCVYIEQSAAGLRGDAARAAAAAELAPHVHARQLLITRADITHKSDVTGIVSDDTDKSDVTNKNVDVTLRLRSVADAAPADQLMLWFDEDLLALIDMPFLTLRNIQGRKNYVCHVCQTEFEQPNPLKVHLFLSCRAFSPRAFWTTIQARLAPRRSAFTPIMPCIASLPEPCLTPSPPVALCPARLEALATEWGRAAGTGGHVCVYCGKLYSRKYGLKIHIRTHTGYKPLRCRYCRRAFGDPSNLNKHVRLHRAQQSTT